LLDGDEHGPLARASRHGSIDAGRDLLTRLIAVFGFVDGTAINGGSIGLQEYNHFIWLEAHFHDTQVHLRL
jgi:hypothetical protein